MTTSRIADPAATESEEQEVLETEGTQPDEAASPEEAPTEEGSAPEDEAQPQASDAAEPTDGGAEGGEEPDSQAPEAQPAAENPEVAATPFSFRVHGRQVDVPDAVETPYGIVMSREAFQRTILPRLTDPDASRQRESQLTTKIRELETAQNEKLLRAEALVAELDPLLEDPEKLVAFVQDYQRNRDLLEANVKNRILEGKLNAPKAPTSDGLDEEGQIRSLAEQLPGWLDEGITALMKEPDIAALGLTPQQMFDLFWPLRGEVFVVHPASPSGYGLNVEFMRAHLAPMVTRVKALTAGSQKQVAAAKHNARALGQTGKAPPPVAGAKGSPAATPAPWKPKSREEYEAGLAALVRGEDLD